MTSGVTDSRQWAVLCQGSSPDMDFELVGLLTRSFVLLHHQGNPCLEKRASLTCPVKFLTFLLGRFFNISYVYFAEVR